MKLKLKYVAAACLAMLVGVTAVTVLGQDVIKEKVEKVEKIKDKIEKSEYKSTAFCSNNNWSSDSKVSVADLREMVMPAGGTISVDAGRNGGVSVKGTERNDVLVRACVQAWGMSDEAARGLAQSIRINASGGTVKADGPGGEEQGWSVSYQILAPRNSNLKLWASNGGISISNIDGSAEFETKNGGVSLYGVSGDFRGRTTNGGVNVTLLGNSWRGNGLDVTTTNGGVHISMPANFGARIQTGTVNGGFSSDIAGLTAPKHDEYGRRQPVRIDQEINGGGALIKAMTTNGGVRITTVDGQVKY